MLISSISLISRNLANTHTPSQIEERTTLPKGTGTSCLISSHYHILASCSVLLWSFSCRCMLSLSAFKISNTVNDFLVWCHCFSSIITALSIFACVFFFLNFSPLMARSKRRIKYMRMLVLLVSVSRDDVRDPTHRKSRPQWYWLDVKWLYKQVF